MIQPFAENVGFTGGQLITSGDKEKTFKFESIVALSFVTVYVKSFAIRQITVESVTGTFSIGQTISKGTSPNDTVATIYGISGTILYVGPSTINGIRAEFTDADSITGSGGATAVVSTGGVATASNKFAFSTTTSGGTYSLKIGGTDTLALFNDRAYRFDVSDSSMNGLLFKLSPPLMVSEVLMVPMVIQMTALNILVVRQLVVLLVSLMLTFSMIFLML